MADKDELINAFRVSQFPNELNLGGGVVLLNFPRQVLFFEKQEQWNSAIAFLWASYVHDKDNMEKCVLLGLELWFVISFRNEAYIASGTINDLYEKARCIYCHSDRLFSCDFVYNLFFGYMLADSPYYFMQKEDDYEALLMRGYDMCEKARAMQPINPIAILFCLQRSYDDTLLCAKKQYAAFTNKVFPSNSGNVNSYFRDVLMP